MSSVRIGGIVFQLFPIDHEPRHVHALYAGIEVIVDLLDDRTVALSDRTDAISPANAKRNDVKKIDAAIALANLREPYRPKAVAATYRAKDDVIVVKLATGVEIAIPRKLLQGLENATPEQAAEVEIWGPGSSLHWEAFDVDHYVPSLIEGVFGNRRWMSELGKRGGAARTKAKAQAARKNGRKGGRPRKRTAV